MDASPFKWIEERGPKFDLHGAIDDATGRIFGLYFRPNEDLRGYLEVMNYMSNHFGIPRAIYTDGHAIFFSPKKDKLTIEEELAGKQVALTQLGRVIDELGIIHIHARSPQAKGRIERLWNTLPVSYTHLDVYKRQVVRGAKALFDQKPDKWIEVVAPGNCLLLSAVGKTNPAPRAFAKAMSKICLLYTSRCV